MAERDTTVAAPDAPQQPPRSPLRTVPVLEPDFYAAIHRRLVAAGGHDAAADIAYAVGNALFNTGLRFLRESGATDAARRFRTLYGRRTREDHDVADRMIDFLVDHDPSVQARPDGFIERLLDRLEVVLSDGD